MSEQIFTQEDRSVIEANPFSDTFWDELLDCLTINQDGQGSLNSKDELASYIDLAPTDKGTVAQSSLRIYSLHINDRIRNF